MMTHNQLKKMLYFYRRGELTPAEADRLKAHFQVCPECSREWKRIQKTAEKVNASRENIPKTEDPGRLTRRIMSAIRPEETVSKKGERKSRRDTPPFIDGPLFRFGLVAVVCLILCTFFYQEILVLQKVSKLEEKAASKSAVTHSHLSDAFVRTMGNGNGIRHDLKRILVQKGQSSEEWILSRKSCFDAFRKFRKKLEDSQGNRMESISKTFPELLSLIDSGINDPQRIPGLEWKISRILRML